MEWIRLFNPQELQRLIGGEGGRAIDVEDLKRHTLYAGGYHHSQPVMQVGVCVLCCAVLCSQGHRLLSPRSITTYNKSRIYPLLKNVGFD